MQCSCKSTTHPNYWGNCYGNSNFLKFAHRNKSWTSGFKVLEKITLPMWKRMRWTMVLLWMHSGLGSFALFFIRFWKTTPAVMLVFKCSQVFYIVHCMNGFFWWWWMVRPSYPPILSSHYESLCFHNLVFLLERCLFFPSAASWKPSCAEQGLLFIIYFKNLYLAPVT